MPAPTTVISSGGASELSRTVYQSMCGGLLGLSHISIEDHIAYAQHSDVPLLHATLKSSGPKASARVGSGSWVDTVGQSGSISVTPAGWERHGRVGNGTILGLQIGFELSFMEEACEQPLSANWRAAFNALDAKAFALAREVGMALPLQGGDRLTFDLMTLALARHVGRAYGRAERARDDGWLHPAAMRRAIALIRENPARAVSLEALAQRAGLGVSAFVRAFRGSTGTTPAAFALRLRLNHAEELLKNTDLPIFEIAQRAGFASPSHFVSSFSRALGTTPGRWRRGNGSP